jgi:preprotein translocase subunit SecE
MINRIKLYFQGVISESKKIAWPTRDNTINNTLTVIAVIAVATILFGAIDYGLSEGLKKILEFVPVGR